MNCPENQEKKLPPPHQGGGGEVLGVKKKKSRKFHELSTNRYKKYLGNAVILNDYTNILGEAG